jgi:hypothetical protein
LKLQWNLGVLLPPQLEEGAGKPAPVSAQPVNDGMAGRAKSNQPGGGVPAGPAVMNGALMGCPAALAVVAVAGEHGLAVAAEASARMRQLAAAAPPGDADRRVHHP